MHLRAFRLRPGRAATALLGGLGLLALSLPVLAVPAGAAGAGGPVTIPAPGAGAGATVTVSRTTGIVNQTVSVRWSGFKPSSSTRLQNSGDSLDVNTENPVRVYECRGTDPAGSSDCYGSPGFRGVDASGTSPAIPAVPAFTYLGQTDPYNATPDGPANWQDNVTRADGTGSVTIQLFTKRESAALGCDSDAACSIVVVPNYGRGANDIGDTEDVMDAPWAWDRRTVVPMTFQPVDDACPIGNQSLGVEGSPIAADLLASWRARTCALAGKSVALDYTAIGEPQTRLDVASQTTPVGLTIDPLDSAAAATAGVVYAPVSVTGLVVAFQVDDANGRPVTSMKLNARLVAKLVTASYRSGADPAVIKNPFNIFRDPEFLSLNPGVDWPSGAPGNHVLLLGDLSDTTQALTRWVWSDAKARSFLQGKPDPWGMTVNTNYQNVDLPFRSFPLLDQNLSSTFAPIQGMDALARQLSIAQFPGAFISQENGQNITVKPPRQNPGAREVIGLIDAADASRFLMSTASLQNASGTFVKPTNASFLSAISHSAANADGVTRSVDLTSKAKDLYPLALQVSAALSTKADKDTRTRMAHFLDYVAVAGQVPGDEVGLLPAGHAPLPPALRSQVVKARDAVLAGAPSDPTTDPTGSPSTDPTGSPTDGPGSVPGITPAGGTPGDLSGVDAAPTDGPTPSSASDAPQTDQAGATPQLSTVSAQSPTGRLMMLPGLLVLALVGLIGGPLLLWLDRTGRGPQWLRR